MDQNPNFIFTISWSNVYFKNNLDDKLRDQCSNFGVIF